MVHLTPSPEREALVRGASEEILLEPQPPCVLPHDELAERLPPRELGDVRQLRCENLAEHVDLDRCAEHRCVAQQKAVGGIEGVQPREDRASRSNPERLDVSGAACCSDQLADVERIAAGAVDQRLQHVRRVGGRTGSSERERLAAAPVTGSSRSCVWPPTPRARAGLPCGRLVTAISQGRDSAEPVRCKSSSREASSIQCASSSTISVGITSTRSSSVDIASCSRARLNCAFERLCLGRRGHVGAEDEREQRQHRHERGHDSVQPRTEVRARACSVRVERQPGERSQQRPKHGIFGRRRVLVTARRAAA